MVTMIETATGTATVTSGATIALDAQATNVLGRRRVQTYSTTTPVTTAIAHTHGTPA